MKIFAFVLGTESCVLETCLMNSRHKAYQELCNGFKKLLRSEIAYASAPMALFQDIERSQITHPRETHGTFESSNATLLSYKRDTSAID